MPGNPQNKYRFSGFAILLGIVVMSFVIVLRLIDPGPIREIRLQVFDYYQKLAPRPYEPVPVRVIDIDEASLREFGQWPWPRTLLSKLLDELVERQAAAIIFDMVFPEPDRTSPALLVDHLPKEIVPESIRQQIRKLPDNDTFFASRLAVTPTVLSFGISSNNSVSMPLRKGGIAHAGSNPETLLPLNEGSVNNLAVLEQSASGVGSFSIGSTEGAIVRRLPLLFNVQGEIFPALGIEALRVAQRAKGIVVRSSDASGELSIGGILGLQAIKVGDLVVPTTTDGHLWLHYTEDVPARSVSARHLLSSTGDSAESAEIDKAIAGNIVIIGTSAEGLKDLRTTPLSRFVPGSLIHAQGLEQMILQKFLFRPAWADGAEIVVIVVISLIIILLLLRLGAFGSAVLGVVIAICIIAASWFAYTHAKLLLDPVYTLISAFAVYLSVTLVSYLQTERHRGEIIQAFSTYLAPAVVQQLVDDPSQLRLGGEMREMTFLFTDVAEFTTFSEQCEPEELVSILQEYMTGICNIVMDHGGTIDKLIGDALVALFNAPIYQDDHATRAVRCALALDKFCTAFSSKIKSRGKLFGVTRIGINTGEATVGNFGSADRFDYTANGDAMNTAARLEGANKYFGTRICVSKTTLEKTTGFIYRPIGELVLKGKSEAVTTFEIMDSDAKSSLSLVQKYREAYDRMRPGDKKSAALMFSLSDKYPDDPLITFHANRIRDGEFGVRFVMTDK